MGWFDSNDDGTPQSQYNQLQDIPVGESEQHKPKLTHELLGGAAAFEAAKAYEDHVAKNGKPDSHAKAKEFVAGAIGAFLDREIETRGLDKYDEFKQKRELAAQHAQAQVNDQLADQY